MSGRIAQIVNTIDEFLRVKDEVREWVIRRCRDIIREAGYVVTDIHNSKVEQASERIVRLRAMIKELSEKLRGHPEISYSGTVYSALGEYVEAEILLSIVKGVDIPDPKLLGIHPVPYLQGLLDVVGELKRLAIDSMRRGDLSKAWELLKLAEEIYQACKALDYPEALIPGVRRKTDVARAVVESLRTFLTDVSLRYELMKKLDKVHRELETR